MTSRQTILTFGHGTASAGEIVALLQKAGAGKLVDIRTAPGSRHNPHVARAEIGRWLPEHGVGYRWEPRLGGWRKAKPDSPDTALRNKAFAGYAGHMRTPEFLAAIDQLLTEPAPDGEVAVMCAEAVWWRCHRRMVADFLVLARNLPVQHLGHDGRLQAHVPTETARLRPDGLLVYDAGQAPLPDSPR